MGVIVKYKFDQTIYENLMPTFNSGFTDYTITDEIDTDGFTIRTIDSNSGALPTVMRFGTTDGVIVGKQKCLLDVISLDGNNINDMGNMFRGCQNLKSVSMSNVTSKVTGMNNLFRNCSSLTILNISNLDTSQVTRMGYMFYGCSSLTSLDTSNFNTSQVTDMNNMFNNCSSLTSLNVSNFNTEKVENMQAMFQGCSSLTSLDLSNFNTEKVVNMSSMFQNCSSLTSLDLSNFNTENVNTTQYMFSGCSSLVSLDLSNFNTENVNNMTSMFTDCSSLTSLDLSNFNTENVTGMGYMFRRCSSLTSLNVSNFNTEKVTNMAQMFYNCSSLTFLDVSNFNTEKVTDAGWAFRDCFESMDIGTIYCNSSTINKISDSISTNTTVWYHDANISDLTVKDNITYKKYKSTTLSLNEPIQLRSIGDVHDEINYETGEYIQRIGEIVFDGSEDWQKSTVNGKNAFTVPHGGKAKGGVISLSSEVICDKNNAAPYETFFYIGGSYFNYLTTKDFTRTEFKQYLSENPITVQYQLAQPIITKIDTTILDQNNSYKSFQQTYDEQTYVSVQSDTVVTPTSSVDYEIYSSTGTITGTSASIDNAEAGTPVSGVVYGETLLNVIQEPSEDEFVCIDSFSGKEVTIENSVAGNLKDVIIKGQALPTNIFNNWENKTGTYTPTHTQDGYFLFTGDNIDIKVNLNDIPTFKRNVEYTFIFRIKNSTYHGRDGNILRMDFGSTMLYTDDVKTGIWKTKMSFSTSATNCYVRAYALPGSTGSAEISLQIIEGDYTNQDIPYFEGIGSVTNPSVTVCGKNLFNPNRYTWSQGGVNDGGNPSWSAEPSFVTALTPIEEFPIKQGETAYLTCTLSASKWTQVFFYDNTKARIGRALNHGQAAYLPISVTVPANASYFRIHLGTENVETGTMTYKRADCVANIGYTENTVTVNENIELNSIGDVCDELNVTTGELTQRIGEIILNGVENWSAEIEFTNTYRFYLKNDDMVNRNWEEVISNPPFVKSNTFRSLDLRTEAHDLDTEHLTGWDFSRIVLNISKERLSEFSVDALKTYIQKNPITVQYQLATESIKTVDLSIVDQDNVQQKYVQTYDTITHLKPQSYGLIPTVEYKAPTYDVLLKENTQYTIKLNRTNIVEGTPLTVNLGGTELSIEDSADSFTITTPSTLTNNTLSIGGTNNKVKEVMVIEGDYVDRDLDFFEGFVHVENPMVQIYNDNIWGKLLLPPATIESFETDYAAYITTKKPILVLKPNTRYIINANITTKEQIVATLQEITENGTARNLAGFNITGTGRIAHDFDTTNGEVYLNFYPGYNDEDIKMVFDLLEQTDFTICEYSKYDNNINTVIEKKSNTLTTYPQITLRSIGDIKDEWDVVGETVTRRIGKIVLDGSENWNGTIQTDVTGGKGFRGHVYMSSLNLPNATSSNKVVTDKTANNEWAEGIYIHPQQIIYYAIPNTVQVISTATDFKQYLSQNPITVQYELATPITESVRITPPNPQTSTASITIPTQLDHVADTSDFLVWNPYKEHYVRYNYVEDGVVLDNYTWENLTDLNERQFVEFYNRRTYIDQPYHNYVASHDSKGTSKYVLIEPNQNYTVSVRFSELPTCETVKVNLGGAEVEMNVNDPHVHVTTPNTLANNLCSISGDGLDGKVTDILVIHCLEHEGFADIDYFEGIDGIGEIVEVEGVPKSKIIVEQTNGNLIDKEFEVWNNGQSIRMSDNERLVVHPNTKYIVKFRRDMDKEPAYTIYVQLFNKDNVQTRIVNGGATQESNTREFTTNHDETMVRLYTSQLTNNGSTHRYCDIDLCYANMSKDYIRPRYYDEEEILLPIQLHRINTVYDNFYYDEMKGYYRIQQSIGHKYFVGADSENWTLIERGQRVLRFRYNNADIQMKSLGEFMTNILPNGTATSPYECCAFNGINFIVSIDKERLSSESLTAFKEWLANNNLHLYYQLASPLMIDLPEYSSRIEFNTYKDEIYTFFKNCKPTVFTLAVPLDQTYRFYELEQGEGYANRVELTDERMTDEDKLYVHTIYGSGISNLIEEPNNVDTMLKPNYEGKATSHSLTNGKVSTIGVHGFEPNNVTISNYNTVTKQYELTVQAQQGTNTNTKVLPIPYKFEVYEDGTKDRVYYSSQYKQWMFEGGQTLTVPYNTSTGAFTNAVEVFRGLQPRSGLIGEFKVKFASGTTSARLYYSINGTTYGYTTLRGMTDGVDYYIGFFNTGGSKIDMGTKIDANAEYTTLVPINGTIPECLMINQIQNITECTYYQDKTYYYSDVVSPLVLDVYNGTTTITELNGAVIDIQNNAHNKQALIYGDTTYTVYWTYVGGDGNIKVTLGGVTQEVVATQGYATITTSDTDLERGLFIGGFNVTIKDLMLVKGERITDLKYFEGSRAVGTAFTDENGETMYKITLVTGSELINDKFEETITFEDNKKHNVVVTKLLGAKPDKI